MKIEFKNTKYIKPDHGRAVAIIHISKFYGSWSFQFVETEYSWDNENGTQITYDPKEQSAPVETYEDGSAAHEYKLYIGFGNEQCNYYMSLNSQEGVLWQYLSNIETCITNERLVTL